MRADSQLPVLSLVILLAGCSDWNLFRRDDPEVPSDTSEDGVCEEDRLPGAHLETVDCEPPLGQWEVRELWSAPATDLMGVVPRLRGSRAAVLMGNQRLGPETVEYVAIDGASGAVESLFQHTSWGILFADQAYRDPATGGWQLWISTGDADTVGPSRVSLDGDVLHHADSTLDADFGAVFAERCYPRTWSPDLGDADQDGQLDVTWGLLTLDHELNVESIPAEKASCGGPVLDLDGDGIQEVVTAEGVYRLNGTPRCLVETHWTTQGGSPPLPVDMGADGSLEFLWGHSWLEGGTFRSESRLRDADCNLLPIPLAPPDDRAEMMGFHIGLAAPLFERETPAYLGSVAWESPDGSRQTELLLLDENLDTVRKLDRDSPDLNWNSYVKAADLDGDGLYELLVDSGDLERGSVAYDPREERILMEFPGDDPLPVDVDGDGHVEIVVRSLEDTWRFVALNAAEGEWGWAQAHWQFHASGYRPGRYLPDGSFAPPDYARENAVWLNVAMDDGHLRGAEAELTVRIGDVCDATCDRDRLHVRVHAGNAGTRDVERAVRVVLGGTIDGEEVVLDEVVLPGLEAGVEADSVELIAENVSTLDQLWARVEPDGWLWEGCTEREDTVVWEGGLCE